MDHRVDPLERRLDRHQIGYIADEAREIGGRAGERRELKAIGKPSRGAYRVVDHTYDVVVVGAGPTGVTLAATLRQAGVDTLVIDQAAEGATTSRAGVVHAVDQLLVYLW